MRIEINISESVAKTMRDKAKELNHSRKSYIEYLCIKDAKVKIIKSKTKK